MRETPHALLNFGIVLGGWVCIRIAIHAVGIPIPTMWAETPWRRLAKANQAEAAAVAPHQPVPGKPKRSGMPLTVKSIARPSHAILRSLTDDPKQPPPRSIVRAGLREGVASEEAEPEMLRNPTFSQLPRSMANNLSLSGWALYRPETSAPSIAPNGQLGGSQAGLRLQRRILNIAPRSALSLNLRLSTPLSRRREQEFALGTSFSRGGAWPVEVILERRVAIGREGRNAFAAIAATGIDDLALPGSLKLSGYAQGGLVGIEARDGFADGAVRVERQMASAKDGSVHLGVGAWGAVQPGASRVDVGPVASVRFKAGTASMRLSAEWRQRVAGTSNPGSGPAITLGFDY